MKIITYILNGNMMVDIPCIDAGMSEDAAIERARLRIPAEASEVHVRNMDELPDRHFRPAWAEVGGKPGIDMVKARAHQMSLIRKERDKKLEALDKEWMIATGKKRGQEADQVEAKRQSLRDLPQTVNLDSAQSPEELKAIWPNELK